MNFWKIYLLAIILCAAGASCGKKSDDDEPGYDCGVEKDEPLEGRKNNRIKMNSLSDGDGVSYLTTPSDLRWTIKKVDDVYTFTVDDGLYMLSLNADFNGWNIILSEDDDQIFGSFSFFKGCWGESYKFEIYHNEKTETYTHPIHIL